MRAPSSAPEPLSTRAGRAFRDEAMRRIEADFNRSSDTHLIRVDLPSVKGIQLYLKDESIHITGSLKHRLARSLFLYALVNGWIDEGTTIIEASSGSTAISEAYFARLLGLPFIAVMPRGTSAEKIRVIERYGARCHLVDDPNRIYAESERLARETRGHFMDQFTYAERATDWRGNNNIAESIFAQMSREPHPIPRWIVCGAGTGGTSATIGRYVRYHRAATSICVVDPEHSVFYDYYRTGDPTLTLDRGSCIEGIGRPRVEPSFLPAIIDRMIKVPDAASYAAIHFLNEILDRRCGGSTGTNLWGALQLIAEMAVRGEEGSVVTLICDGGERYLNTYYDEAWLAQRGHDLRPHLERLWHFHRTAGWPPDDLR
jgi:cysteine synthase A